MEFSDPKGIYQQIADRVQEQILQGVWIAGDQIPSVREMAVELGVNPNTVARSYQALVERRILANQRGRGFFVTEEAVSSIVHTLRNEFLEKDLPKIINTMRLLDIRPEEIAMHFRDNETNSGEDSDETKI